MHHHVNSIKVRSILSTNLEPALEVDCILNSGVSCRLNYKASCTHKELQEKLQALVGKDSKLYDIDANIMKLDMDNVLPFSIMMALASSASRGNSLTSYISQSSIKKTSTDLRLLIPIWTDKNAKFLRCLFVILEDAQSVVDLPDLSKVDLDKIAVEGGAYRVLEALGNEVYKFSWGLSVDMKGNYLELLDELVNALQIRILINSTSRENKSSSWVNRRYEEQIQIFTDNTEDESYEAGICLSDQHIPTLSYLADYVHHLNQKHKLLILKNENLKNEISAVLVDAAKAFGIPYIMLKSDWKHDGYYIVNQLTRFQLSESNAG